MKVERVTRESNFYDAEKAKKNLMEAKLPDARLKRYVKFLCSSLMREEVNEYTYICTVRVSVMVRIQNDPGKAIDSVVVQILA
ncbi:hypothetical protein Tco_1456463 [Tanacetum coccineum]